MSHHSSFDCSTDFPGGNGVASYRPAVHDDRGVIELAVEAKGSSRPLWFHVRFRGLAGERIDLRLANALQLDGDPRAWAGNTIVLREGREPWRRSSLPIVEMDEVGVERVTYPLFVQHDVIEVAWCFPYQRADLHQMFRACAPWNVARIGRTANGQVIERYRSQGALSAGAARRPGIYILARQAAGDVAASWVLDGLIRAASRTERGRAIADEFDLWITPFVDFDGVESGAYGRTRTFGDFDDGWTDPPRATEINAVMLDLMRFSETCTPFLIVDLECTRHSVRDSYFVTPAAPPERIAADSATRLIESFRERAPESLLTEHIHEVVQTDSRGPRVITWAGSRLQCSGLTMRVSHQGTPARNFEIEDYQRLGQALLEAVGDVTNGV